MSEAAPVQEQSAPTTETAQSVTDISAHMDEMAAAAQTGNAEEYSRLEAALLQPAETKESETKEEPTAETVETEVKTEVPGEEKTELEPETPPVEKTEEEETPSKFRIRLPEATEEDRAILAMAKAQKITVKEATRRYDLANKPAEEEAKAESVTQIDPTILELETKADAIRAKIRETAKDEGLFTPDVAEMQIELAETLSDLKAERRAAKTLSDVKTMSDASAAAMSEAQIRSQWKAQDEQIVKEFADLANPNSPLSLVRAGLINTMKDPSHHDHAKLSGLDAPRFIITKAAEALNLVPKTAPVKATPVPVKEVARPAPGSRTTTAPSVEKTAEQVLAEAEAQLNSTLNGGHLVKSAGFLIL